jgi:hypothetical protein
MSKINIQALLVAMLVVGVVAAFFAGAAWQKRRMDADVDRFEKAFEQVLEEENRRRQPTMIDEDTMIIDRVTPRRITPLD